MTTENLIYMIEENGATDFVIEEHLESIVVIVKNKIPFWKKGKIKKAILKNKPVAIKASLFFSKDYLEDKKWFGFKKR